jgi:MFS family permease
MLLLASALLGLSGGSIQPLWGSSMAARFAAAHFGKVMGRAFIAINMSAVGAPAKGRIYDATGSYKAVLSRLRRSRSATAGSFALNSDG